MNPKLNNRIMRRVYYAYAVHMATRPIIRRGVPLLVLVYALSVLVHVSAIFANITAVGIANSIGYFADAITHTDVWTLTVLALIGFVVVGIFRDALSLKPSRALHA